MYPFAAYLNVEIPISTMIALLVCLIPTTIGGLLSAIGIAGMDRVTRFNVIAMSGKAVEACGDVDTMILDKTGTITYGNRLAAEFYPVKGTDEGGSDRLCGHVFSVRSDPGGKIHGGTWQKARGTRIDDSAAEQMEFIEFYRTVKMSGVNLPNGSKVRKGAAEAIKAMVKKNGGTIPADLDEIVEKDFRPWGTPLVVTADNVIYGVIYLKDTVKPGLAERFQDCGKSGSRRSCAPATIRSPRRPSPKEAGVDGFIAECKPEDKIEAIRKEQAEGQAGRHDRRRNQ